MRKNTNDNYDNGNSTITEKPKLIHSIQAQISILNLAILIAFLLVNFISIYLMVDSNNSSKTMSDAVLELNRSESELTSDITSLYDQVSGYIMAAAPETKEVLAPEIALAKDKVVEDIATLKKEFEGNDDPEVQDALARIESEYAIFSSQLDEAMTRAAAGNNTYAQDILYQKAVIQKVAISHALSVVDRAVVKTSEDNKAYMDALLRQGMTISIIGTIIVFLIIIFNYILNYRNIISKIKVIYSQLNEIISNIDHGKGDLTSRITTKSKSELLYIINGINKFIESLQGIMKDVKEGSEILTNSSEAISSQVRLANQDIVNTSEAMEKLSAGMNSVTDTVTDINERVNDVRSATSDIAEAAKTGSETANAIKNEAIEIKTSVNTKKTETGQKMEELSSVLDSALKDSEKVSQINELTKVILDISSHTNLLALNASIEAARAGEAGKGFAVVASEISELADDSRKTAANIQNISVEVTEAVGHLSTTAKEVMEFINTTVLQDYDEYVETGEKYENTAVLISDLLDTFTDKADHLETIMESVVSSVADISNSVSESSEAIGVSAKNASNMVGEIKEIDEAMLQNTQVTERLDATTNKFISL
ncbi:MAG: methyl-accepting chemotaxis protein [Pseudobutyrivibrio sp.]|nr:methyl-accepting chemotaxis protein [Pseudobutyrivibrio sp.]